MNNDPIIPSAPEATPEDIQAINEVSRDYIEGWFTANEERMRRALHPELMKRTILHDLQSDNWQLGHNVTTEAMAGATRDGGGSELPESERTFEITVLDVFREIATVKVSCHPYMDYLHVAKINNRWWIVNCLYQVRQGERTIP